MLLKKVRIFGQAHGLQVVDTGILRVSGQQRSGATWIVEVSAGVQVAVRKPLVRREVSVVILLTIIVIETIGVSIVVICRLIVEVVVAAVGVAHWLVITIAIAAS